MKSILSVAEAYAKMSEDSENLASTNAAETQKKQEDQPEIPSWVPGNIPDEKKKEFVEAVKKAYESDNTQFDFDGRTYKITEKLVGDQDKLDVDGDGKIDADDLAALRAGEKVEEDHMENETETPGQTQYPGSEMPAPEGDEKEEEENDEGLEESVRLKKMQDMMRVTHGAMSRDEYKKKWAHLKKPKNKLAGPGGLYRNLVKEAEENPTDKLTIDVPAMIRALEKSREDFKTDADIHNFVQALLKKKDQEVTTNDLPGEPVKEALDPKDDAGVWISDFVHSTNPKFDGKSKEERKQMALAAYYQARRDAGLKEEVMTEATAADLGKKAHALSSAANTAKDHKTAANAHYKAAEAFRRHTTANAAKTGSKADAAHDAALKHEGLGDKHLEKAMTKKESTQISENVAGDARAADLTTAANQASALAHSTPIEAGALMHHDAATKAHQHAADHYRVYAHHAGDPELRRAAEIHHKFHTDMAQHHTLKGVSLSVSETKDSVKEGTAADAKGGPEVMDPVTKKAKEDADKNTKAEEAPYTNKADGSEEVTPAEKPKANPSPMPTLTKEQALRSVADTYSAMVK